MSHEPIISNFFLFLIFIFSSFHFMDTYVKKSELSFFLTLGCFNLSPNFSFLFLLLSFLDHLMLLPFWQLLLLCDDFFFLFDNSTRKVWYLYSKYLRGENNSEISFHKRIDDFKIYYLAKKNTFVCRNEETKKAKIHLKCRSSILIPS